MAENTVLQTSWHENFKNVPEMGQKERLDKQLDIKAAANYP